MRLPALRRAAEVVLVRSGAAAVARRRVRGRTLILAYHNIVPNGLPPAGDRSLHLPLDEFRTQLDLLTRQFDVVPLGDTLSAWSAVRPRAAITFDDAYQGAVTLGVAELTGRGLPATIFVSPGLLGGQTFWWDEAASHFGPEGIPAALREEALWAWQGDGGRVRAGFIQRGVTLDEVTLPPTHRSATLEELALAVASSEIRLASHSWSHPNLAVLDGSVLEQELTRPLAWLRERFGNAVDPWIAYPYGTDSAAVHQAAGRSGHVAALRIHGRWTPRGAVSTLATARWNIPAGITPEGFALRLVGFPGL